MNDNFAATHTMPPCKMVLVAYVIPLLATEGTSMPNLLFLIAMPRRIDAGMPETGMLRAELRAAAPVKPTADVAAANATPGRTEGSGFFSFFSPFPEDAVERDA